jgi:hypothetical protein
MTASKPVTLEWLKHARAAVNDDPAFRRRGSIDVKMALRVDKTAYLVTFAGFSCHDVQKLGEHDLRDADFVVQMTPDQWHRFAAGRRSGTGRTLAEIDATDGVVQATNPRKKLDFLRYHTSIQAFFDAGARADAAEVA